MGLVMKTLKQKLLTSNQIKKRSFNFEQEPWRLLSRQAEFDGTDSLRLDAHSDDQAVTGNQGYFED